MNTQLTDQQIDFYRENGFLVIDEFLVDIELASWRQAVDEAVVQHVDRNDTYHNQRGEDDYYKNVFVQCVNLWKTSEKIKQLVLVLDIFFGWQSNVSLPLNFSLHIGGYKYCIQHGSIFPHCYP